MISRRQLLASAALAPLAAKGLTANAAPAPQPPAGPVAVSSANGLHAVAKAVERMKAGADPLDAAIDGVGIVEDDPNDMTVGYGGIPNEEGVVQLDASCMHGPTGRAGAVASLEGIKNPVRVAKLVMETTDHVLLVGPGARRFAEMNGFPVQNLLTDKARKVWLYWKQNLSERDKWVEPPVDQLDPDVKAFIQQYGASEFRNPEAYRSIPGAHAFDHIHDPRHYGTIHLSAVNTKGDLAGCTTTSGLFFKMPGRAGDSPIIGAGCFTDNDVGSAGSTGRGEANILVSGGHLAVEMMRQGHSPREACLEVLRRIAATTRDKRLLDSKGRPAFGIKFYAVNKRGEYGSASMWSDPKHGKAAKFAVADARGARLEECAYLFEGQPTM